MPKAALSVAIVPSGLADLLRLKYLYCKARTIELGEPWIFNPYHSFNNALDFKKNFSALQSRACVAPSALNSPRFCESSIIKLNSAKYHLETLLSYGAVYISPPPSVSVGTGSTISATGISQITDYDVSRELDDFFGSLFGAFDVLAQVINLVFFPGPLPTRKTTFYRVWGKLTREKPTETLTIYITSLQTIPWYKDFKRFRNCTTHQNEIEYTTTTRRSFLRPTFDTKIILPDNPFSYPPTYSLNREFGVFGIGVLKEILNAIDHMYGLISTRILASNHIPV